MKILRLGLSNLASLSGEQNIDFESEPLAHAGLIAITGKTGAGKSTLLDAMCLALFDQIPRLNGAAGTLQDASGQGIAIKDSKHILRRGCTHAYAEVEFIALDQKRYQARWEIRRARNKLNGNLKVDRTITCLDDAQILTSSKSEASPLIQKLIGLSFEQFTRAVLLAQSEVGAFLKAKDQDRADLLEYLTNSNIFSLISQLSFAKTKHYRDELEQLQQILGHIELLNPEQLAALQQQKTELQNQLQAQQQTQKKLEQTQHWYQQQKQLLHHIHTTQNALQDIEQQQQAIDQQRHLLTQLDQFSQIRPVFHELDQARQQQKQLEQKKQQQNQHVIHAQQSLQHCQQQFEQAEKNLSQHKTMLKDLQPVLQKAFTHDSERERLLTNYKEKNQEFKAYETQLLEIQQQLNTETQQQEILEKQQQQIQIQLAQTQSIAIFAQEPKANIEKITFFLNQWQQLQAQLQTSNCKTIHDLQQQQQQLILNIAQHQQQFGTLDDIEQHINKNQVELQRLQQQQHAAQAFSRSLADCRNLQQQQRHTNENIEKLQPQLQQLQQQYTQAQQSYLQAEQHLQHLQQILNTQKLIQNEHIEHLRSQLKPEHPCMVCGNTQHPFIEHESALQHAIAQIQDLQEQQALIAKQDAQNQAEQLQQQYFQAQSSLHHQQQRQRELELAFTQSWQQLQQDYAVTNMQLELQQDIVALEQDFQNAFKYLQQQLQKSQEQLKHWQNCHTRGKTLFNQQQQHINDVIKNYQQAEHAITSKLDYIWQEAWQRQPEHTAQQLKSDIEQRVEQLAIAEQLTQRVQQSAQQCSNIQEKLHWLQSQHHNLHQQVQQIEQQGKDNSRQLIELISQHSEQKFTSAQAWQTALLGQQQHIEQAYEAIYLQLQKDDKNYQQQCQQENELLSQLTVWQHQIEHYQNQQQQWLSQHPEFDQQRIDDCLSHSLQQIQALRNEVQSFQQNQTKIQSNLAIYQQQLDQHQQHLPEIAQNALQQYTQHIEQSIQQLTLERDEINAKIISDNERRHELQQYQQQLTTLQQQINRWGKISELIGSKEGTKFQRIAQEHHLDILVEYANQQLQPLAPRYQLKRIDNSLGLAIIDHDMNAEQRPVLSLSGGETFLVSLALALAIANMASGNMKLESLFIDEGFGTLDPTSLHIVMDALDRLQSQGRKVVLISHVQEMHERIPVQIQVQSIGAGASQIKIIG
ncbi:AAA family ATPase [Acinetobacter qingfengensis]|uniref:Rad50/SbcC-type AAA domain-containing protein n=1 Tax=Acinetobacter qingfengensis TaxID=1262585 RepID=A0A1E7REF9_9GAMM|nr:AAA family ATPase [Acinetobacter qingfengensis]KAA8735032.1 AAA family ATPase [Acinetobacter qingfengensis]OEY97754.1 hypothetical protein BJI46_08345 [Acinetobacter qingfengensis]